MEYTTRRIEVIRGILREQEVRIAQRRRKAVRRKTVAEAADRFASQARDSILAPDENVESLDRLARAMRPLGDY